MQQIGRFLILSESARGLWGPVFLAWDPQVSRTVMVEAVPLPGSGNAAEDEQWAQQAGQSARAAARVQHPQIVSLQQIERDGGQLLLVTEAVNGPSLSQLMAKEDLIDLGLGMRIWRETAEALDAAHAQGVLHGLLHPRVILLNDEGQVRLANFGLQGLDPSGSAALLSLPYSSPERLERRLTPASDQYSLAAIIYEMLTSRRLFPSRDPGELSNQVAAGRVPPPSTVRSQIPLAVDEVLLRALSRDPQARYANCAELVSQVESCFSRRPLAAAARASTPAAPPAPVPPPAPAPPVVSVRAPGWLDPAPANPAFLHEREHAVAAAPAPLVEDMEPVPAPASRQWLWLLLAGALIGGVGYYLYHRLSSPQVVYAAKQTLSGHTNAIPVVAVSPDGKRLVTASSDHTVRLWDAASRQPQQTLELSYEVAAAGYTPDGGLLVTASNQRTVEFWDALSLNKVKTLTTKQPVTSNLAFSLDGELLAVGNAKGGIELWSTSTGKPVRSWQAHDGPIGAIAFSPDGKRLATGSTDRLAKIWDAESEALLSTLQGHEGGVTTLAFAPDGKEITTGSYDGTAKVWDASSGKPRLTLKGHTSPLYVVAYRPDGQVIATGSNDSTARLWDVTEGKPLLTLTGHKSAVTALVFFQQGADLLTGSSDKTAIVWELQK